MPTYLDGSSLTGLDTLSCRLVSLLSGVDWPTRVILRQLPSPSSFVQLSNWCSLPTSGHLEISGPNPLSGFAPKQTKESSAWRTTYIVLHGNNMFTTWMWIRFGNHPNENTWFLKKSRMWQASCLNFKFSEHWRLISSICSYNGTSSETTYKTKNILKVGSRATGWVSLFEVIIA